MHVDQKRHVRWKKGDSVQESQRWLAGPAATGIGLLSDLTWGGWPGTGTAPLKRHNYVTTPDARYVMPGGFWASRWAVDSGKSLRTTESRSRSTAHYTRRGSRAQSSRLLLLALSPG